MPAGLSLFKHPYRVRRAKRSVSRVRIALKLRHLHLFRGDELQQRRLAFFGRRNPAPDGRNDVGRVLDALAIAAERLRELRVISGNIGRAVFPEITRSSRRRSAAKASASRT